MIATNNYFKKVDEINFSVLPDAFKKGHEFLVKATNNGESWTSYQSSDTVKKTIDIYLAKLNEFINNSKQAEKKQVKKEKQQQTNKEIMHEAMIKQGLINPENSPKQKKSKRRGDEFNPAMVERIPEELRFIKRFVNLNGKTKTKDEILRFINSLQKAILEKRIRKTSSYAEQIRLIQGKLISLYNDMKAKIKIELKPETYDSLKKLTGEEKVMDSVRFIKRYISLNGKIGMKKKADGLLKQITRMVDKKRVPANDPYMNELIKITKNLETFLDDPSKKVLAIEKNELNGLEGILGCACTQLNGIEEKPAIMNSMDFANMQFDTIGLKGKWFDLIGDPSSNFTAMVFGKPKMGKSYLCIDFAGYLARNHGKVLYVAKEEGLDLTLQQKLKDKDVAHPNLYVSSILPENLLGYDFIFLDSVNKLGLKPEDLNRLKQTYPTKSFIFIFQSTKEGHFRGANSFQHDVDVVIEVPEKGKAVQFGRFNQGGEIEIF
jgi:hypothetical protein